MIWCVINDLRKYDGIIVFLIIYYMEEVVNVDYIVVIYKGNIVVYGLLFELKDKYFKDYFRVVFKDKVLLINYLDK